MAARNAGAERVLVVDRETEAGGSWLQCIQSGFGLHHLGEELTGPEYARRILGNALDGGVDVQTNASLLDNDQNLKLLSSDHGVSILDTRAMTWSISSARKPSWPAATPADLLHGFGHHMTMCGFNRAPMLPIAFPTPSPPINRHTI